MKKDSPFFYSEKYMPMKQNKAFDGYRVRIALVRETSLRTLPKTYARTPEDVFRLAQDIADQDREHFAVVLLNTKNRVLGVDVVSVGTLDASLVHPREVLKAAILTNAASVVICHNHPSSDATPSAEDLRISKALKNAGEIMGITVLDHVILTADSYLSLREEGLF